MKILLTLRLAALAQGKPRMPNDYLSLCEYF